MVSPLDRHRKLGETKCHIRASNRDASRGVSTEKGFHPHRGLTPLSTRETPLPSPCTPPTHRKLVLNPGSPTAPHSSTRRSLQRSSLDHF